MTNLLLPYEIIRDVPGYDGLYKISARGNLYAYPRITFLGKANKTKRLRPAYQFTFTKDKDGYLKAILTKDFQKKYFRVHRLVAFTFKANPDNLQEINHEDFIKTNNDVSNLSWCTNLQNIRHCIEKGNRNSKMPRGNSHYKRRHLQIA